jgi:hypothetical protein
VFQRLSNHRHTPPKRIYNMAIIALTYTTTFALLGMIAADDLAAAIK